MHPCVVVQFGMEGCDELPALPGGNDVSAYLGKDFAFVSAYIIYIWGTNEGHGDAVAHFLHRLLGVETAKLATVGIAAGVYVHCCEMEGGEHYEPGTSAEDGQPGQNVLTDCFVQSEFPKEFGLRGGFTAGNYKSVLWGCPVGKLADLKGFCPKTAEHLLVFGKCSL